MTEEQRIRDETSHELEKEIEEFIKEKARVRAIIGKIGGVPKFKKKLLNIFFITFVLICLAISLVSGGTMRLIMIELAIAALSFKLIYLITNQARVNHLQLWIMTSLEWRINEVISMLRKQKK